MKEKLIKDAFQNSDLGPLVESDEDETLNRKSGRPSCSEVFSFTNIKSSFAVALKKREGGMRHIVIILVLLFGLYGFASNGIGAITVNYIRKKFIWSSSDYFDNWYSDYNSVNLALNLVAIGLVLPIMTQVQRYGNDKKSVGVQSYLVYLFRFSSFMI